MTKTARGGPDQVCVLPGNTSWITALAYLGDPILSWVATAAWRTDDRRYVLPALTFDTAAHTISQLADLARQRPSNHQQVELLALPAWQREAVWETLLALRRARDGDDEAAELADLVHHAANDQISPPRPIADIVADLEKITAVLMLDIPAVKTLATTLLLRQGPRPEDRAALEEVEAAWTAAGIRH